MKNAMEYSENTSENTIAIRDESIRLGQALKLAGIAQTGIEAKIMITSGQVLVNGETEERRGRKLRGGDTVEAAAGQWRFSVKSGQQR